MKSCYLWSSKIGPRRSAAGVAVAFGVAQGRIGPIGRIGPMGQGDGRNAIARAELYAGRAGLVRLAANSERKPRNYKPSIHSA